MRRRLDAKDLVAKLIAYNAKRAGFIGLCPNFIPDGWSEVGVKSSVLGLVDSDDEHPVVQANATGIEDRAVAVLQDRLSGVLETGQDEIAQASNRPAASIPMYPAGRSP
jgi:hypothetical protein